MFTLDLLNNWIYYNTNVTTLVKNLRAADSKHTHN